MVGTVQQQEVQIEDITGQQEYGMEEEEQEVRPSSAPTKKKGKQSIQRSSCKKLKVLIVLPCILEGVHSTTGLLGCVDRLRYAYHDVSNTKKFPEFTQ
jgi:hypothetical protein